MNLKTEIRKEKIKIRDNQFIKSLINNGLPEPVKEYRFDAIRRWRFDFAYLEPKVAIEIEGGIWQYGRHNRPITMIKDIEKYNKATELGWSVLRFTPEQLKEKSTIETIISTIKNKVGK